MPTSTPNAGLVGAIRAVVRLARIADQECKRSGLSMAQYRFLVYFSRRPRRGAEIERLAEATRPAVAAINSGLVDLGLLQRQPLRGGEGDEGDAEMILTPSGRRAVQRAERRMASHFRKILGDGAELTAFIEAIADLDELVDRDMERQVEREADAQTTSPRGRKPARSRRRSA